MRNDACLACQSQLIFGPSQVISRLLNSVSVLFSDNCQGTTTRTLVNLCVLKVFHYKSRYGTDSLKNYTPSSLIMTHRAMKLFTVFSRKEGVYTLYIPDRT